MTMIEARAPEQAIRRTYDAWSRFYGTLIAPLERAPRMLGLERLAIAPGERVLEVAVGPGSTLVEILRRAGEGVSGVDLSPRMLERARARAAAAGFPNVDLREADARSLPFPDGTFDAVYSSYFLDLVPLGDLPTVIGEMRRVLRPGGRIALVNLSKRSPDERTWFERFYEGLPESWVPYLLGGCRPVVTFALLERAGFHVVRRDLIGRVMVSEVVTARAPAGKPAGR